MLAACVSGYKQFYKPYYDDMDVTKLDNVETLQEGEEPTIYTTNNIDQDILELRSKRYVPIGYSSFNGKLEGESQVIAQAKRVGAKVVLVSTEYTDTVTSTTPLVMPDSSTTYHSGSVYGSGGYGGYSGTSTTYGTTVVPITSQQKRFDQAAVFFVKSTKKLRFGVSVRNLTDQQRRELKRNTGALIDVVFEETPAFYSNVIAGDILIKIDDKKINDGEEAGKIMRDYPAQADDVIFTVLRDGEKKQIKIDLN